MNDQIKRPRGRPRPQETISRDARVLDLLQRRGPLTRNQVADELGLEKVKAYLSLDRLRKEGRLRTCADAQPGSTLWSANVGAPCP